MASGGSQRKSIKSNSMSGISGRRKRRETMISIRKSRKEDGYAARRNMAAATKADDKMARSEVMKTLGTRMHVLLSGLSKNDQEIQAKSLKAFVLLMSSGVPPLFDDTDPQHPMLWETIMAAVPKFLSFFSAQYPIMLQSNAAFALRFICSMDRSQQVIAAGALPILMQLLGCGVSELQLQAAWCLGNIACESAECCRAVLSVCKIEQVLPHLQMSSPSFRRAATWLLRSLLDHIDVLGHVVPTEVVLETAQVLGQLVVMIANENTSSGTKLSTAAAAPVASWRMFEMNTTLPPPNDKAVVRFVSAIDAETVTVADLDINFNTGVNDTYVVKLSDLVALETMEDEEGEDDDEEDDVTLDERALMLCDCCWALVELSSNTTASSEAVLAVLANLNVPTATSSCLEFYSSSVTMISPILRLLENIVSGSDDVVVNAILSQMPALLYHKSKTVREECCWFLSNVAAGATDQVLAVLNTPELMPRLAEQLSWAEWDVRREAAWVVCNVLIRAPVEFYKSIIDLGVLDSFSLILSERDPQVSVLVMEAMIAMLKGEEDNGSEEKLCKIEMDSSGCFEHLENLAFDENPDVSAAASTILDTYLKDEDEMDLIPSAGESSTMTFQPVPAPSKPFNFS